MQAGSGGASWLSHEAASACAVDSVSCEFARGGEDEEEGCSLLAGCPDTLGVADPSSRRCCGPVLTENRARCGNRKARPPRVTQLGSGTGANAVCHVGAVLVSLPRPPPSGPLWSSDGRTRGWSSSLPRCWACVELAVPGSRCGGARWSSPSSCVVLSWTPAPSGVAPASPGGLAVLGEGAELLAGMFGGLD